MDETDISKALPHLNPDLLSEIKEAADIKDLPRGMEILREGQYVSVIPIVLQGLIKVFTRYEDKELLLYYIKPSESCIMSFSASMKDEPSKIVAMTEEDTTALLLPVDKIPQWTRQFPDINQLFFQQYNLRYSELLDTINHLLFDKLDKRLLDYLGERSRLTDKNPVKISHRQIAQELGTSREVISRILKKLEREGSIQQEQDGIKILDL